jgi:hypothetical protein
MAASTKVTTKATARSKAAAATRGTSAEPKQEGQPRKQSFGKRAGQPRVLAKEAVEGNQAAAPKTASKARKVAVAVGETAVGAIAVAASFVRRSARGKTAAEKPASAKAE